MAEGYDHGRRRGKRARLVAELDERISTEEPALHAESVGTVA